jgi:hypothetical protein
LTNNFKSAFLINFRPYYYLFSYADSDCNAGRGK